MPADQHTRALAWAKAQEGKHEVPPGSNTGPFVRMCQRATWLAGTRWPWCVAFWIKAWRETGRALPYLGAGAYAMLAWYHSHAPTWVVPLERAKPGACVIFNIGAGHAAMLERPYLETKPYVHTIDGNVSDQVAPRVRPASLVRGVVDPPEVSKLPPQDLPEPQLRRRPLFEVVTSESGHAKVVYVSGERAISRKLGTLLNRYGGLTIRRHKRR